MILKKQIWVMWSAADLQYTQSIEPLAFELGATIAKMGHVLVYGAEKDNDSLSAISARWAKSQGGFVLGITYWNTSNIRWQMDQYTDCIVCTGMERWWGREFVLVSSCDAIITLGWGSGTLNEITIAYQKKIPIVCMQHTWWRSEKLSNTYIDERYISDPNRYICKWCDSVDEAILYLNTIFNSQNQ